MLPITDYCQFLHGSANGPSLDEASLIRPMNRVDMLSPTWQG